MSEKIVCGRMSRVSADDFGLSSCDKSERPFEIFLVLEKGRFDL